MPWFKLLRGFHHHGGRTYVPGEVFSSEVDMVTKHGDEKFGYADDPHPAEPVEPTMSKDDHRAQKLSRGQRQLLK